MSTTLYAALYSTRMPASPVRMHALILTLALIVISPSWAAQVIVTDADTLVLNGVSYRLDGIDAPETDQVCLNEKGAVWACGIEARDRLVTFIGTRNVRCDNKGRDTAYLRRRIGICWVEGESGSLNQWLVREGWALNFEPYAKGRFISDQSDAKDKHRGLWKGCFSAPQEQRYWEKKMAVLLGSACPNSNDQDTRNALFPDHADMPAACSIKGKLALRARLTGYRGIYHTEGCLSYKRTTKPDRWFCSEDEALAEGFRKSFRC